MTTARRFILSAIFGLPVVLVEAQESDPTNLPSEQIEVVKDFEARLDRAEKINLNPRLPEIDTSGRNYSYRMSVDVPSIEYVEPSLRPLALTPEPTPRIYRGFARAGYGTPNAALGELQYHLVQEDQFNMGVDFSHRSAQDFDNALQRYMDNDARVRAQYLVGKALNITGSVSYSFDDYYYYAEDPNDPNPDFDKRRYKSLGANLCIANPEPLRGDFHYHAGVEFVNHQDDQGSNENNVIGTAFITKWINDKHQLSLLASVDYGVLDDIDARSLTNFWATPSFTWNGYAFTFRAGLTLASDSDNFIVYPDANVSVKLAGDKFILFAGATGGLKKNNFYTLSTYNPYIATRLDTITSASSYYYYGGLKGDISIFRFSGKFSYIISEDLALFLPERSDARTFQPIYDDVDIAKIEAAVEFDPLEQLEVRASVAKMFYTTTVQEEAWHLPELEASADASYKMFDNKLTVGLSVGYQSGIRYIRDDRTNDTLKALFDISAHANWFVTNGFGLFVEGNNLTGTESERWQRYPTYGINFLGGLMFKF